MTQMKLTETIKEINDTEGRLLRLYKLAGVTKRSKRGLIEDIGDGMKKLFGTMSNEDSIQITDQIRIIEKGEEELNRNMQTTVKLISEINDANKKIKNIQKLEDKIDKIIKSSNEVNWNMSSIKMLRGTCNLWPT